MVNAPHRRGGTADIEPGRLETPSSDGRLWVAVTVSYVLVLLTFFWVEWGRWSPGHDDWHLRVADIALSLRSLSLAFLSLLLFGGLIGFFAYDRFKRAKTGKEQRASTAWCVASIALFSLIWPWTLSGPFGTLLQVMANWSDVSNQYFAVAYQIDDARAFTSTYSEKWQEAPSRLQAHVATHPPGAVLFYYGARRVFEASPGLQNAFTVLCEKLGNDNIEDVAYQANKMRTAAARSARLPPPDPLPVEAVPAALFCNFLLTLALAFTVPAVYIMASIGSNEEGLAEARGMVAALFFALAPCLAFFAFTLDVLVACGAAWTLACTLLFLKNGRAAWMLAAGALLALTTFISFGAMATGAIVALTLVMQWKFRSSILARRDWVSGITLAVCGFVAIWAIVIALFPMHLPEIFQRAMLAHKQATLGIRDFRYWVWLNLVFFLAFLGWPVAVGLAERFAAAASRNDSLQWPELLRSLGWATLATILLLTVSGKVMGEVERLWLFLVPPCCAVATSVLVRPPTGRRAVGRWLLLIGLQVVQTIVLIRSLVPLVSPI